MTETPAPRPHQVEGIEWLTRIGRGLLADSPRSGKSRQLLEAATEPVLVLAPSRLRGTWEDEIQRWTPGLDATFSGYSSVAKRVANKNGHNLLTVGVPKPEYKGPWGTVICDESHNLTNPKADQTGAISRISSERLYLATGTPIPHWASDMLMTLRLIFPGDRRFTNWRKWQKQWFKVWEPPWGGVKIGDLQNGISWEDFWLANSLDGPDGRMLQREVDLGVPFTEQEIMVEMTPGQKRMYEALKADYVAWEESSGQEVSAWSDGGLHTKLHQLSTGVEIVTDGAGKGSGKLAEVRDQLEATRGHPTLLFCHYQPTAGALMDLCKRLHIRAVEWSGRVAQSDRDRARRTFQAGDADVLVGSLGTVAEGLTLDRASTEIFVEHSWTPWRNEQALKRAMIAGKTAHVHIIHLWTPGTVDVGMRRLTANKTEHQVKALSAREFRSSISG